MNKKQIVLLTDYKGHFGSRYDAVPHRSGFDLDLVKELFQRGGYALEIIEMAKAKQLSNIENIHILYTSSEDIGYHYKSFIEDIVYYLELKGANVIPAYKFLRANNNKVFMELLEEIYLAEFGGRIWSDVFGTLEEMQQVIDSISFPIVIKTAEGAMSEGVFLAKNKKELEKKIKQLSKTRYLLKDIKDTLRPIKHKGYKVNSRYRNKFVLQQFIPNLLNDWKVLIFGDKYFIFSRPVRKNDFRASGSGSSFYSFGSNAEYPGGIFDFASEVFKKLNIPQLSIDIAFDGNKFYVIEIQAIYFGTVGVIKSDVFYQNIQGKWVQKKKEDCLEKYYVNSIVHYLNQ